MNYLLVSLDRFEEHIAVCEDMERVSHYVGRAVLPMGAKEGDCFRLYPDGHVEYDEAETQRRRQRIIELQRNVFCEE